MRYRLLFILLPLTILASAFAQGPKQRNLSLEHDVVAQLNQLVPAAVASFEAGTTALDLEQYALAKTHFEDVLALVPDFVPVLRRLSHVETNLGDVARGRELAGRAFELEPSLLNQTALAAAMVESDDLIERFQALSLARDSAAAQPTESFAQVILLSAALSTQSYGDLYDAALRLSILQPEWSLAHYYLGLSNKRQGKALDAARSLERAASLGMPGAVIAGVFADGLQHEIQRHQLLRWGGLVAALLLVILAMSVSGVVPSLRFGPTVTVLVRSLPAAAVIDDLH